MIRAGGAALLSATVIAGCLFGRGPAGPELVLEVINNTDAQLAVSVEWETGDVIGDAEAFVPACQHQTVDLNEVGGDFRVRVAADEAAVGSVPDGVVSGCLRIRIVVDADGRVAPPERVRYTDAEPSPIARRIGDCGR